jgi:L-threonylcarbamoyladenylate synthase
MNLPIFDQALRDLKHGGVVLFPTDTVWGIGASIEHSEAIRKLYEIIRREYSQPTAVMVSDIIMAKRYGELSLEAEELALRYWPGSLTIVVPAKTHKVPALICGESGAVGIRIPKHDFLLAIIQELGCGLVAASANISGDKEPGGLSEVKPSIIADVDLVVDTMKAENHDGEDRRNIEHLPSTVVDATQIPFQIIREGSVKVKLD